MVRRALLSGNASFAAYYSQLATGPPHYLRNAENVRIANPNDAVWFDVRLSYLPLLTLGLSPPLPPPQQQRIRAAAARLQRYTLVGARRCRCWPPLSTRS